MNQPRLAIASKIAKGTLYHSNNRNLKKKQISAKNSFFAKSSIYVLLIIIG